jgi:hypothetical protein
MAIDGFSDAEMHLVQATLHERYGRAVTVEDVEVEVRLHPADRELVACPALYWKEEGCDYVVSKTGANRYRSMFFFGRIKDRYTSHPDEYHEYDNLGDCLILTLKVQEEVARQRARESAGA